MTQIEVLDSRKMLGERVSDALRARYGAHAAKQAARITGADLRTAQGWVSEAREPRGDALLAIIREFGRDAIDALFGPEIETHNEKLERELHDLREEAARLEALLAKSGAPSAHQLDELAFAETCSQRVNQSGDRRGAGSDRRKGGRRASDR